MIQPVSIKIRQNLRGFESSIGLGGQHNDGDLPFGAPFVGGIARISLQCGLPAGIPFCASGFPCKVGLGTAVLRHGYLGMDQEVMIPGRVLCLPPVGGNDNEPFIAVGDGYQGHGARLATFGPGRGQAENLQAGEKRGGGGTAVA